VLICLIQYGEDEKRWAIENMLNGFDSLTLEGPNTEFNKEEKVQREGDTIPTTEKDISME
jgi:hypothetical protein